MIPVPGLLLAVGDHGIISGTITVFTGLLAIAVTVGVLTKFVRVPYTIALVLAGLVVASLHAAPPGIGITEDLVFLLFLPPLLFQAGLHLDLEMLQRKAVPVALLAIPGVLVSTAAVALAIGPFLPGDAVMAGGAWLTALLFGAMLAPTDPISVLATFRDTRAPTGLRTLVEGDSLFNDGTGVVLFLILLSAVFGGGSDEAPMTVADGILQFLLVTGMGVVIGLGLGLMAFWILRRLDDHVLENAITVVLAWGTFITAERLGASGVIATVVAGLIIGNYGQRLAMSRRTSETINTFWESIDFIINSIVFLLIGFELQFIGGAAVLLEPRVLLAVGAVVGATWIARACMVYPVAACCGGHWPSGWKHVLFWSGLKGSIPMALVLGLPDGAFKTFVVPVAFGVVLLSLLGQGLTIGPLVRRVDVEVAPSHGPTPDDR